MSTSTARRRLRGLACLASLVAAGASPALAQTASQITPPSFRPADQRAGSSVVFSGRPGLGTPAGADKLNVRITGVTIEGGLPELAAEQAAIQARLSGRRVPASEIFAAARDLEAAFTRAGYVLARVILPAQTLKDGSRLRLVIINGYVERIEYRGGSDAVRERLSAILEPIVGQRGLGIGEIERKILLAGDTPGVQLRSTLTRGREDGGTVLVVDANHRPVTGFGSFDNTLSPALGQWTLGVGLEANTLTPLGEQLYFRAFGHPAGTDQNGIGGTFDTYPLVRTLSVGGIFPLGVDGLTFNVEATESRTTPSLVGAFQSASEYDRLAFRLRYPWIRARAFNFNTDFAFDATSERLSQLFAGPVAFPLSQDRLRIFRLGADGDYRFDEGGPVLTGRGVLSLGVDGLGARNGTAFLPLSRIGASPEFQKFDALVSVTQPILQNLVASVYVRGQTSFGQALPRSEQIGFASFQELSTFDAGTLGGDSGWIVRGELASPNTFAAEGLSITVTPYVFGATGMLYLEAPTVLEKGSLHVSSIGGGLRFAVPIPGTTSQAALTTEFGRRFRDDALPDSNRFTVVGSIRF